MCRREALPFSDVSNESHRFTYSPSARPSDRPQFRTASDASPVRATSCRMPSETDRRVGERKRRKERVSGRPEELSSTGTINRLDCGIVSSLCANGGTDADSLSFPPSLLLSPFHFSFLHLPSQRKTWRSIGRQESIRSQQQGVKKPTVYSHSGGGTISLQKKLEWKDR